MKQIKKGVCQKFFKQGKYIDCSSRYTSRYGYNTLILLTRMAIHYDCPLPAELSAPPSLNLRRRRVRSKPKTTATVAATMAFNRLPHNPC